MFNVVSGITIVIVQYPLYSSAVNGGHNSGSTSTRVSYSQATVHVHPLHGPALNVAAFFSGRPPPLHRLTERKTQAQPTPYKMYYYSLYYTHAGKKKERMTTHHTVVTLDGKPREHESPWWDHSTPRTARKTLQSKSPLSGGQRWRRSPSCSRRRSIRRTWEARHRVRRAAPPG